MTKRNKNPVDNREFSDELEFKNEFRDQYQRKKQTQKAAKERRRLLRELNEDKYWN